VKRSTLLTLVVVVAIAALFFYMTTARASTECEVCMTFHGQSTCATAVGSNEKEALQGAQTTACGPLTSGMDQTIACGRTEPASTRCRAR
jgi:uncharacterized protein (UPF0333 family)